MLSDHLSQLDLCYFEITEVFNGLADSNVWKRPDAKLLSIGELAGHMAYWEAVRFGGDSDDGGAHRDLSNCNIKSSLLDPRFGYYTSTVDILPLQSHLEMTGPEILGELTRIHREAMNSLRARNPDLESQAPHWHGSYSELLKYVAFHAAYHTGQMYTVRHLLGETPPDN